MNKKIPKESHPTPGNFSEQTMRLLSQFQKRPNNVFLPHLVCLQVLI